MVKLLFFAGLALASTFAMAKEDDQSLCYLAANGLDSQQFLTWARYNKGTARQFNDWVSHFSSLGGGPSDMPPETSAPASEAPFVRLATDQFVASFAQLSPSQEAFDRKVKAFYDAETFLYRGRMSLDSPTNEAILKIFAIVTQETIGFDMKGPDFKKESLRAFEKFNKDAVTNPEKLKKALELHTGFPSDNPNSHFASFSTSRALAAGFSTGFGLPPEKKVLGRAQILIKTLKRKVASADISKVGELGEYILIASADPESVVSVTVQDFRLVPTEDPKNFKIDVTRERTFTRVGFNRITQTEEPKVGRQNPVVIHYTVSSGGLVQVSAD